MGGLPVRLRHRAGTARLRSGLGGMGRSLNFRTTRSLFRSAAIAASVLLAIPQAAAAQPAADGSLKTLLAQEARGELRGLYAHRATPLWITGEDSLRPAAEELVRLIQTAEYDGLDPAGLGAAELAAAVRKAELERSPAALVAAELALTDALARYVTAMLEQSDDGLMIYEHSVLRPYQPTAATVLHAAAEAPSLDAYVSGMRWMHPLYAQIRGKLTEASPSPAVEQAALASLQRVRAMPAPPWSRHIVIDIAGARLWMYEGDRPVDSMRIVVGKPETPTPIMAGYIRQAVVNPYWNVPENLVRKTIAAGVLGQGMRYLRVRGYEVLSDWSDEPELLDPATVDWRAVSRGDLEVRVRQKPNDLNAMGSVKFEFPNPMGIYLHDTPDKKLLLEEARQFSNGCVRLEDADRLGRWLLGGALPTATDPETRVDLAQPVPIYITYLTVTQEGGSLAMGADPYGLDGAGLSNLARVH